MPPDIISGNIYIYISKVEIVHRVVEGKGGNLILDVFAKHYFFFQYQFPPGKITGI